MKMNLTLLAAGLIRLGIADCLAQTLFPQPVSQSSSLESPAKASALAEVGGFTVVDDAGTAFGSTDGITWKCQRAENKMNGRALACGNGVLVKVGPGDPIRTSFDGLTWINRTSATPSSLHSVAYGNGIFVAVGNEGAIVTSTAGIAWTRQNCASDDCRRGIAYGDGIFVAV